MDDDLTQQIHDAHQRVLGAAPAVSDTPGRLTARQRVGTLVDTGSLIEYGALAGRTTAVDDDAPSDGLVCGSALLDGHPIVVAAYDARVLNGSQSDRNQRKMSRMMYLAITHRWPFVCFVDGDGARPDDPPPAPPIMVAPRGKWGLYDGLAELSGWAPTIAVISGRAVDGHLGIALLCDFVVATAGSTTGAVQGDGALSARPVEALAKSGDVDHLSADDGAALATVRQYLGFYRAEPAIVGGLNTNHDKISEIIPDNRRRPYDMRKVVHAFADTDSVLELGAGWGRSMLTMLARLDGQPIGIFANQPKSPLAGAIDSDAADKAARFVELCDTYEYPLVSFVDNPGYMVGPQAERDGIARHHARPLAALHQRSVPLCSIQVRKAYGLGPYAMSGWGTSRRAPELKLAWPSVESGGMSLEGAAFLVKRKEIQAAATREEQMAIRDAYAEQMRDAASGLKAARAFMFDDVIEPHKTRATVAALFKRFPRSFGVEKKHAIDPR